MTEHRIDDHHIFPDAFLRRREIPAKLRETVLNRTLFDRKTNIRISDRAPSDYMREIKEARGDAGRFDALLDSHHVPSGTDSPIWNDDYETFLAARQEGLWARIREATGLAAASSDDDE